MKRTLSILLVLAMTVFLLAACGQPAQTTAAPAGGDAPAAGEKFKVGYTNLADTDNFLKYSKDLFLEMAKSDPNIEIIATDANLDVQKQLDQINDFIAQEVDCIIVTPVDFDGVVPGIEAANAAGIPVISLIITSGGGEFTFVGSNSLDAGRMQGELMTEILPQGAKIVYLQGTPGLAHSKQRLDGFTEGCLDKRPDIEVLASMTANYNRDEGMKLMEDWIQSFDQIDAVVAANDQMALGAIQALKTAGRLEGVIVTGIDATYDACVAIDSGEMTQSIFQNGKAQVTKTWELLQGLAAGKPLPGGDVFIPYDSVVKDNVAKYLEDYKAQGYPK